MTAEECLRAGKLDDALAALQAEIRKDPNHVRNRIFLFQLSIVLGRWDRALTQLKVVSDLDAETIPMLRTYEAAMKAEMLRAQVFAGERSPLFVGEPEEWLAFLLTALKLTAQGKLAEAETMRTKAFDAAPTTAGTIDGERFEWIADADTRLGPVLEAVINGRYQWIPMHRLSAVKMEAPADLRDVVWTPATLTLASGGETVALIPTRYPRSEENPDDLVKLARKTDWSEPGHGAMLGMGQRLFATNEREYPLMDIREIAFDTRAEANG